MESSKFPLRSEELSAAATTESVTELTFPFQPSSSSQPWLSTFPSLLLTARRHKWRRGLQPHLSTRRSFQTGYVVHRIHSLSAELLTQLNLGEHFSFTHSGQVYDSKGQNPILEHQYHPTRYVVLQMLTNPQGRSLFIPYGLFPLIKTGICFLTTAKDKKKVRNEKGYLPC